MLVADDDNGVRALVRDTLEEGGFDVVEATCGRTAIEAALAERPLLVVLDVVMPTLSGYEVCRTVRERYGPHVPIVFLSGDRPEPHDRVAGLLLGGDDYLVKPFAPEELLTRVRLLVRRAAGASAPARLTPREHEVLRLLADGLNQKEIAGRLVISRKTVGTHIERILDKLEVHSRAEAVAVAYRDGLVLAPAALPHA